MASHKIILGITGGIAAYKAAELTRLLVKDDFDVQVVMTESASQFITPLTFQALSGKEVLTSLWKSNTSNGMSHIELSRNYDLIVIAPASANFLAKLTHGFADDLLSSLCLARNCPIAVAPAMNVHMWTNQATQRNVSQLQQDGVIFFGPDSGEQACGDINQANGLLTDGGAKGDARGGGQGDFEGPEVGIVDIDGTDPVGMTAGDRGEGRRENLLRVQDGKRAARVGEVLGHAGNGGILREVILEGGRIDIRRRKTDKVQAGDVPRVAGDGRLAFHGPNIVGGRRGMDQVSRVGDEGGEGVGRIGGI